MLTFREAKQRAIVFNGNIRKNREGEYECTLNEWTRKEREERTYFTDDIDDALFTLCSMRREATSTNRT